MCRNGLACALVGLLICSAVQPVAEASDCNGNGVDDSLEVQPTFPFTHSVTDNFPTFGGAVGYFMGAPPIALTPVTFQIDGVACPPAQISAFVNGAFLGATSWNQPSCGNQSVQLVVPASTFNSRPNGPNAGMLFIFSPSAPCGGAVTIKITFGGPQMSPDCNNNGLPDTCDLVPAISATPSGNCAQAEPVVTGYVYRHSCEKGSSDYYTNSECAVNWTVGNVYYTYTPSGSGPLHVVVQYDDYRLRGLQPSVYLYSGCPITHGTLLACASSFPAGSDPLRQEFTVNVMQGVTYYLRIAQWSEYLGTDYALQLDGPPALHTAWNAGWTNDCNVNGSPDACDLASGISQDCDQNNIPDECEPDCNHNGIADACDLAAGTSADCDQNGVPDECEPDCNQNGVPDACDIAAGTSPDCNQNGIPDACEVAANPAIDCNHNGVPDSCDLASGTSADCNSNRIPDECDLATGVLTDCNNNQVGDACEALACRYPSELIVGRAGVPAATWLGPPDGVAAPTQDTNVIFHFTCGTIINRPGPDFNIYAVNPGSGIGIYAYSISVSADGVHWYDVKNTEEPLVRIPGDIGQPNDVYGRSYDLPVQLAYARYVGIWVDTIAVSVDAVGAIHALLPGDCNANGIPDECDLASGVSADVNHDGLPDECAADCNQDGIPNVLAQQIEQDCNQNGVPDGCDLAAQTSGDCNANGWLDECDIAAGRSPDCNHNGIPDECDLASGGSKDCNANGVPDECDLAAGSSQDCTGNGVPDECDIAAGLVADCDHSGVPDMCEAIGALTADAGPDHTICPGELITLGGAVPAVNGAPPYTFQWLIDGQPRETPVLDQQQTVANTSGGIGSATQSFTAGLSGELRAVEVNLVASAPSGTLQIRKDVYGPVLAEQTVSLVSGWQRFDLDCPPVVTAGQVYAFYLESSAGITVDYHTGNPYPGGSLNGNPGWDMLFKTYVGRPTGLCRTDDPHSAARPVQTTRYRLQVTDANGCRSTSPEAVVTVRPEVPCFQIAALQLGGPTPYVLGQSVPVTVQFGAEVPTGGATVNVAGQGFASFALNVPAGATSGQQDVTMQSLGEAGQATAALVGIGGTVTSAKYDVLPMVQSVSLSGASPYTAGSTVTITVTLREAALPGGATVNLVSDALNSVNIAVPGGSNSGLVQVVLGTIGSGYVVTATGVARCTRSAVTPAFEVLPAGELYVSAAHGNDDNNGQQVTPVATIGKALAMATDGYRIHVEAGTYAEHLVVDKSIVLVGESAERTIVDAGQTGRALMVTKPRRIAISGLSFVHGNGTGGGNDTYGGAVYAQNPVRLTLQDCTIRGSTAAEWGGGLYLAQGVAVLNRCTIEGNTAGSFGGGICNFGTLYMTNCTVSGNVASPEGGFSSSGGLGSGGTDTLSYCTITDNTAAYGGGLGSTQVVLNGCIVAGNHGTVADADIDQSFTTLVSQGHNLIGDAGSGNWAGTDILNANPALGPLAFNGGATRTHAPWRGSPAIDVGEVNGTDALGGVLLVDQRGWPRPVDGNADGVVRCDIGAVERPASAVADFDGDRDVDLDDLAILRTCLMGPGVPRSALPVCQAADLDGDGDVDLNDFGIFQRCYSGANNPAALTCGH